MDKQDRIPQKYKIEPWSRLPYDILVWTQEQVFRDGDKMTQNYGGNLIFYEDEVNSICDWLIPNIKDKVFYDVGANLGIWSVIATLCGAKEIHMFEPNMNALGQAEKNVRHANSNIPIYSVNRAVGERLDNGWSYAMVQHSEPDCDKIETIDRYSLSHCPPDFIKIDTEGAEFSILRGAQNVIKKYHPMLMVESHSGPDRDAEIISLAGQGYNVAPIKDLDNHRHVFLR